jgi:hypothetical protein
MGILASAELHEMALAAGGAGAVLRSAPAYSKPEQNQQAKQPAKYPAEGVVPSLSTESGDN